MTTTPGPTRPTLDQIVDGHDLAVELAFAMKLATAADAITLPHYEQRSFTLDWKANRTEVTEADRESELAISDLVLAERPHHGLYGEEHGVVGDAGSPWRWIIDPIDGTSNFVRGIPVWASLIALTHVDHGHSSASCRHRRWAAGGGRPTGSAPSPRPSPAPSGRAASRRSRRSPRPRCR